MHTAEDELKAIEGLHRIETTPKEEMQGLLADLTHAVYPHDQLYGQYCAIQAHVDAPPEEVFAYMADVRHLEEWTYSLRHFRPSPLEGVYVGRDTLGRNTDIYCKVVANPEALTVDYHCAWDQGEHLWMIYLNRIVPARLVLNRPGSVIFWQNCRHPFYDDNPFRDKAPAGRPWVGDFWDLFYAGHTLELENLKRILEFRQARRP
jgi:hypothetical protein